MGIRTYEARLPVMDFSDPKTFAIAVYCRSLHKYAKNTFKLSTENYRGRVRKRRSQRTKSYQEGRGSVPNSSCRALNQAIINIHIRVLEESQASSVLEPEMEM